MRTALTAILFSTMPMAAHATTLNSDGCNGDAQCIRETQEEISKFDCVDVRSAKYLGNGSVALAKAIAEHCLSEYLIKYHPETTPAIVHKAERDAPGGVIADLIGKVPGVGDAGDYGMLTLQAEQNFDCRATHPGGSETVCNAPLDHDAAFKEEYWDQARGDEFSGRSRAEFDTFWSSTIEKDQQRRRMLEEINRIGSKR